MKKILTGALAMAVVAFAATSVLAERAIKIVGSSTVYPFTTVVAEKFGIGTDFATPVVESTGTGGGMKLFCAGTGVGTPDFTNASRAIKAEELALCRKNGVSVTEFIVGIDGIVVANSNKAEKMAITVPQLWLALGKKVFVDGKLVDNPYKKWSDIDPSLPDISIEVLGPPPSSGTRDALTSLVLKKGAAAFGIKDKSVYKAVREDGAFIEAGENDNLIVRKLATNPNAFGIFGYSFLEENSNVIQASDINGVSPDYDTISTFEYPVARYLYLYVKREHVGVIPGMMEFLREYTSYDAVSEDGYLAERGLIALPAATSKRVVDIVLGLKPKK